MAGQFQSARVYQDYWLQGSFNNGVWSKPVTHSDPVLNAVGQTRNYGVGTPANGSTPVGPPMKITWLIGVKYFFTLGTTIFPA